MVADIGELEKIDAYDIHVRSLNAKKVLTPQNGENFEFPDRRWNSRTAGGDHVLRTSTSIRDHEDRGEEQEHIFRIIRRLSTNTSRLISQPEPESNAPATHHAASHSTRSKTHAAPEAEVDTALSTAHGDRTRS